MATGARGLDVRPLVVAIVAMAISLLVFLLASNAFERAAAPADAGAGKVAASDSYGHLPLAFQPNAGRYDRGVDYLASSNGGSVALSAQGATLTTIAKASGEPDPIHLSLAGGTAANPEAIDRLPGVVNDLRGDDPSKWTTDVPTFSRIRYESVYPGIDLDWHGTSGTLEYDFRLAPGADPDEIALDFGSASLGVAPNGELVIGRGEDAIRQAAPVAYQRSASGERQPVASSFTINANGHASFALGAYDPSRPLVIDPVLLSYSTYLGGGSADSANAIAIDDAGAAYVTGNTTSTDFDSVGQIEGDSAGMDVFVSKLNPAGSALVYSTYLGGDNTDTPSGIAVDSEGSAYVTGGTASTDFNTVGQIEGDSPDSNNFDAFVSKLTPAGSALAYSTYLGGNGGDLPSGIAIDSVGAAYITGDTTSTDFDTVGQIEGDSFSTDVFVSKLNPAGSALAYSTYIGGGGTDEANGIAVDSTGAAYVTGFTSSTDFNTVGQIEGDSASSDAFVSKLTPAGTALAYSTYLGGNDNDYANAIAVDSAGAAYVIGSTGSTDFNTVGQIQGNTESDDAFVSKLNPAGSGLVYSTYLGAESVDSGNGIAVDSSGAAYVAGSTASSSFNTVNEIEGNSADGFGYDAFVSKLNPAGNGLAYSTYVGGNGTAEGATGVAVDSEGAAYVAGYTNSSDFNTVGQIEGDSAGVDAFAFKIAGPPETTITAGPAEGSNTSDSSPTFGFSSSAASSSFQCRADSGTFTSCASPFTVPVTLADGPHTFEVRAIDSGGNLDPTPASRTFTVDTTPPDTQIDSGPSGTTPDQTPDFTFSSSAPDAATFECRLDGGEFAACTSPFVAPQLADGPHVFEVRARDTAGNADQSPASRIFTVDHAACDDAQAALEKSQRTLAKAKKQLKKAKKSGSKDDVRKAKAKVKKAELAVEEAQAEVDANC